VKTKPAHDFVTIGKLHPFGYLDIQQATGETVVDTLGRNHLVVPCCGLLNLIVRAEYPSIQYYVNDIAYLLQQKHGIGHYPSFFVNCSDRGTGWDLHAETTFVFLGRLWKDSRMTGLLQMSYAPDMSAFNRVERQFATVHDNLVDVIANDKINGVIPKDSLGKKQLMDEAVARVCKLENRKPDKIHCIGEHGYSLYNDLAEWRLFFDKSRKSWDDADRLKAELYQFLVKHAKRCEDFLLFYPCTSADCQHCVDLRANTGCPALLKQLDFQGMLRICDYLHV
jgi:hypothetical protein